MRTLSYAQAVREAHMEEMKRDENILLIASDMGSSAGDVGQTAGLFPTFGSKRVLDAPLSESAYVGTAVGLALGGKRTIAEVSFADFSSYAFDAIVNQAAKIRYLSDGQLNIPLTVEVMQGCGMNFGAQHSQIVESWYMNVPGLKIVVPTTAYDAKGLLKTAIRDDDPVLFLQHKGLCFTKGEVPEEEYLIPLGQAKVVRSGTDVTIVAIQKLVLDSLAAAEELQKEGISVEIIDPRTLVPLDTDTIFTSVGKTGRVVVAHESAIRGGVGGEISALIAENCFKSLKSPIMRVGAANTPIPFGPAESFVLPNKDDIVAAVKATLK